jgi:hypothetical protein
MRIPVVLRPGARAEFDEAIDRNTDTDLQDQANESRSCRKDS